MSLHAQLSPEAQQRLAAQQRNSTISSILISILTVVLVGIGLLAWLLPNKEKFTPEIVSYEGPEKPKDDTQKPKMTNLVQRKPSPPSGSPSKVLISQKVSLITIPTSDAPDPSADFGLDGDGDGLGEGFEGDGGGPPHKRVPPVLKERCSRGQDRLDRLDQNGGNARCEEAVMKSLRWLKKTQNADGSWCSNKKVSMTGFAILAFLGHCETPNSEEFGQAVTDGIAFLVNVSMKNGGKLADDVKDKHWPYEHAIATYALAEAATFCHSLGIPFPNLDEATKTSGDWILEHQHSSGSWDYAYDMSGARGGDTSIALWHIQALKACKHTKLWEPRAFTSSIKKSLDYLESKQNSSGGVGYASPNPAGDNGYTMTGGGMLAYQMWGKAHSKVVRKGARYIKQNTKFDYNTEHSDLYRHYYHAQAMMNRGGEDWRFYNDLFRDQLLNNQNADGSWKNVGGGAKVKAVAPSYQGNSQMANHYRTCLATFMLEVYYRFLPATGRSTR
ncbi:MAG: hypothetical protein ACPG32_12830 [Akkermansiaceae bacterium]